jgi:hypothetical protein
MAHVPRVITTGTGQYLRALKTNVKNEVHAKIRKVKFITI